MKNKWFRNLLCGAIVLVLVLSCTSPASAVVSLPGGLVGPNANLETTYCSFLTGTIMYPYVHAVTTVYTHEDICYAVPGTRAMHRQDATLTITVGETYTETVSATQSFGFSDTSSVGVSIGVGYEAVATFEATTSYEFTRTITSEVGLAREVSGSVSTSVSYTLDPTAGAGVYYIELVFPTKTVTKQIIGTRSNGVEIVLWEETIEYAAKANESYYTLRGPE